ncbi:PGM3 [Symbiodinium sp. KB8]|nr:PGM3 [Symbiodinium sp. KB8]
MEAGLLDAVCLRMGVLAALRAQVTGKAVGVMITASHNPVKDNGMKLVDADGGMLAAEWEEGSGASVVVGRDTRPSSPALRDLVVAGVALVGVAVRDIGVVPTPVVHHVVRATNATDATLHASASVQGYYAFMAQALTDLLAEGADMGPRPALAVDCAHGVGATTVSALAPLLPQPVQLKVVNSPEGSDAALLNDAAGAEYAQKQRLPPRGFTDVTPGPAASLDGDADRVVFHYYKGDTWTLLDGDAIAVLASVFLQSQLKDLGWPCATPGQDQAEEGAVNVGVVQTAYANGASTAYITKTLGLPVVLAKTGVKYVHHAATAFDIGVYFEANGHGTVLFTPAVLARLTAVAEDDAAPAKARAAARRLLAASRLINQAVGDAVSDALFCEAVLMLQGWTLQEWDGLYDDLPSRQLKAAVPDRSLFVPNASETRLEQPAALQAAIDEAVAAAGPSARAFVRPSGTENVVRVYAEAGSQEAADALAEAVRQAALAASA